MSENLLVVLSDAVPGREDEFNEWYDTLLLRKTVQLDPFFSGQRFELEGVNPPTAEWPKFRYLAIYEIPEGRLDEAKAAMARQYEERREALDAGRTPEVPLSPALGSGVGYWFTSIGPKIEG